VLAGALASFFRLDGGGNGGSPADQPAPAADTHTATASDAALAALAAEVSALRRQVEVLTERLTGPPSRLTAGQPAPGEDAAAKP
jgi:hypothetical protein